MVRTKFTARRSYKKRCILSAWIVNREYNNRKQRVYPFRVKLTVPAQKTVNIKKNGQVLKTIHVRRKCKYFSGRNRLIS